MDLNASDLVDGFAAAERSTDILVQLTAYCSPLGFGSLMVGHMTNPLSHTSQNRFLLHTCSPEMMVRLQKSSAFFYDKVLHRMLRVPFPYSWSSMSSGNAPSEQTMLGIVREFGFEEGYSFPIQGRKGTPGGVSLCGDARPRSKDELQKMHQLLTAAFLRLEVLEGPFAYEQYPELSPLEHAVLQCAAGGKGTSETAMILGVPEISAKDALKRARRKFDARTTAQAVASAIAARLIV